MDELIVEAAIAVSTLMPINQAQEVTHTEEAIDTEIVFDTEEVVNAEEETEKEEITNTTEEFPCQQCGKVFSRKKYLSKHIRTIHSGGQPGYACDLCGKQFKFRGNLKKHLFIHMGYRPFHCTQCDRRFNQKSSLERHMTVHMPEDMRPYPCDVCGKSFAHPNLLKMHSVVHSEDRPFQCSICPKNFKYRISLNKHQQLHAKNRILKSGLRPYVCDICNLSCSGRSELIKHKRVHDPNRLLSMQERKQHTCGYCGRRFTQLNNLNRHIAIHHTKTFVPKNDRKSEKFPCTVCNKVLSKKSNLYAHMRLHAGIKQYACNLCGKLCARWTDHLLHYKKHEKNKLFHMKTQERLRTREENTRNESSAGHGNTQLQYESSLLQIGVPQGSLLSHLKPQLSPKKTFSEQGMQTDDLLSRNCSECKRPAVIIIVESYNDEDGSDKRLIMKPTPRFNTGNINRKLKTHSCDICTKTFATKKSLRRHLEESCKTYTCDICGEVLARKYDLMKHKRTHSANKKPIQKILPCTMCKKKFSSTQTLNRHLRLHATSYICSLCDKVSATKYEYNRHMKAHRAEGLDTHSTREEVLVKKEPDLNFTPYLQEGSTQSDSAVSMSMKMEADILRLLQSAVESEHCEPQEGAESLGVGESMFHAAAVSDRGNSPSNCNEESPVKVDPLTRSNETID